MTNVMNGLDWLTVQHANYEVYQARAVSFREECYCPEIGRVWVENLRPGIGTAAMANNGCGGDAGHPNCVQRTERTGIVHRRNRYMANLGMIGQYCADGLSRVGAQSLPVHPHYLLRRQPAHR